MSERRIKSVTAKVTAADYAKCERAAGTVSVSEWARGLLLRALDQQGRVPVEQTVMAEVWALRYIVINGLPTLEAIDTFIREADRKKADKARAILEGAR
jgi:hypothetical protein